MHVCFYKSEFLETVAAGPFYGPDNPSVAQDLQQEGRGQTDK